MTRFQFPLYICEIISSCYTSNPCVATLKEFMQSLSFFFLFISATMSDLQLFNAHFVALKLQNRFRVLARDDVFSSVQRCNVASMLLFCCYFHGNCSDVILSSAKLRIVNNSFQNRITLISKCKRDIPRIQLFPKN